MCCAAILRGVRFHNDLWEFEEWHVYEFHTVRGLIDI